MLYICKFTPTKDFVALAAPHTDSHGIVVSASHTATHILPVVDGRFDPANCKRLDIGGEDLLNFMSTLVKYSHMHLADLFTPNQIQVEYRLAMCCRLDFYLGGCCVG